MQQCIKCPHCQKDITPVIRKSANQKRPPFVNSGLLISDWYVFEGRGFVGMICGSGSEGFVQ